MRIGIMFVLFITGFPVPDTVHTTLQTINNIGKKEKGKIGEKRCAN